MLLINMKYLLGLSREGTLSRSEYEQGSAVHMPLHRVVTLSNSEKYQFEIWNIKFPMINSLLM